MNHERQATCDAIPNDWDLDTPIPPRFWWFKRIFAVAMVLVVALVGLRWWWWGWDARRRLQAEIERIAAAGEPLEYRDLESRELVPDEENAAKALLDAAAALNLTQDDEYLISAVLEDPPLLYERLDEARAVVEKNAIALDLVRQARARNRVDWGLRARGETLGLLTPHLIAQMWLSMLLSMAAATYHIDGDDRAAIEAVSDALAMAHAVGFRSGLNSHVIAMAIDGQVASRLEQLTPTLSVQTEKTDTLNGSSCATRRQVEMLVRAILDETSIGPRFIKAMLAERVDSLDRSRAIMNGQQPLPLRSARHLWVDGKSVYAYSRLFLGATVFEVDAASRVVQATKFVAVARAPDWPTAVAVGPPRLDQLHITKATWERMLHPVAWAWLQWIKQSAVQHFRALAARRMSATALAIRLYEIDHGRRPPTLAELVPEYLPLVPEYLPLVPADPFADDGRTLGYRPDASPPVLYSIGMDGVDDGGVFALTENGGIDWDRLDIPFFLDGKRPTE